MSIIRVGSNAKYADGWSQIFGASTKKRAAKKASAKKAATPKAGAKKAAKKKPAAKKRRG
jgi:hypothetical protein